MPKKDDNKPLPGLGSLAQDLPTHLPFDIARVELMAVREAKRRSVPKRGTQWKGPVYLAFQDMAKITSREYPTFSEFVVCVKNFVKPETIMGHIDVSTLMADFELELELGRGGGKELVKPNQPGNKEMHGGGMSEGVRVVQYKKRACVLKSYDVKWSGTDQVISEIRALKKLHGTGLSPDFYGAWYRDFRVYILMEYINCSFTQSDKANSGTLDSYMNLPQKDRLSDKKINAMIRQLVKNIRERGVFHMDFHRGNIFVQCEPGKPKSQVSLKAGDFGIAAVITDNRELRDSGVLSTNYFNEDFVPMFGSLSAPGAVFTAILVKVFKQYTKNMSSEKLSEFGTALLLQNLGGPVMNDGHKYARGRGRMGILLNGCPGW